MAATIHYRKNGSKGLCFYCLGSGRWVAESKSPPLTYENELLEYHLYVLQWVFYVGFSVTERIGQVSGSRRCKHDLSFILQVWNIKWSFNDSCAHLSRNLTALEIQGRGWNTDKWRAERIKRSWIKAQGGTLCLKKFNSAFCWFLIGIE